jgi:hypothetical protein
MADHPGTVSPPRASQPGAAMSRGALAALLAGVVMCTGCPAALGAEYGEEPAVPTTPSHPKHHRKHHRAKHHKRPSTPTTAPKVTG